MFEDGVYKDNLEYKDYGVADSTVQVVGSGFSQIVNYYDTVTTHFKMDPLQKMNMYCIRGSAKVVVYYEGTGIEDTDSVDSFIVSSRVKTLITIPPGNYFALKILDKDTIMLYYTEEEGNWILKDKNALGKEVWED